MCRGSQYRSLISVMEYLSGKSTAEIMLPLATEGIKPLVISCCLYIDQINDEEYLGLSWKSEGGGPAGSSHLCGVN